MRESSTVEERLALLQEQLLSAVENKKWDDAKEHQVSIKLLQWVLDDDEPLEDIENE